MSLTSCLRKAGDALNRDDRAQVLTLSRKYRAEEGMDADAAAIRAIDEVIGGLQQQLKAGPATEEQTEYAAVIDDLEDVQIELLFKEVLRQKVDGFKRKKGMTIDDKRAQLRAAPEATIFPIYEALVDADADFRTAGETDEEAFEPGENWDGYVMSETQFPKPERTVNLLQSGPKEFISLEEAKKLIASWRAEALRQGREEDHSNEIVFSFFDESGEISKPWREAGYDVRQYDLKLGDDLFRYVPMGDIQEALASGKKIKAVLAQPPCTTFTSTGARWRDTHHDVNDRRIVNKMFGPHAATWFSKPHEYSKALVSIVDMLAAELNPEILVMENPNGGAGPTRLPSEMNLPDPVLRFNPNHFGDPYTKHTILWGHFNPDLPLAPVEPTQGSLMHKLWSDAEKNGGKRSRTPEGFAYALFMANSKPQATAAAGAPADPAKDAAKPQLELFQLQDAYDKATAAVKALGPAPHKPSAETKHFGKAGRAGASPEAVAKYDAALKAYGAWERKHKKLAAAQRDAANALHNAKQAAAGDPAAKWATMGQRDRIALVAKAQQIVLPGQDWASIAPDVQAKLAAAMQPSAPKVLEREPVEPQHVTDVDGMLKMMGVTGKDVDLLHPDLAELAVRRFNAVVDEFAEEGMHLADAMLANLPQDMQPSYRVAHTIASALATFAPAQKRADAGKGSSPELEAAVQKLRTMLGKSAPLKLAEAAAAAEAPADANPVNGQPRDPSVPAAQSLLLMPCSEGKLKEGANAGDMYQGVMWQTLRTHRKAGATPHTVILSAEHGFITPDTKIDPYERKMDTARRDGLLLTIERQAKVVADSIPAGTTMRDVQIVGGGLYRDVMRATVARLQASGKVAKDASVREVAGGIGEQRQQLGQYLDGFSPTQLPAATTAPAPAPKKTLPNVVVIDVRDFDGNKLGDVVQPHDGTLQGIRKAAEAAKRKLNDEYGGGASHSASRIGATDDKGAPGWAISPNLENISKIGSASAAYTWGDLSAADAAKAEREAPQNQLPGVEPPKPDGKVASNFGEKLPEARRNRVRSLREDIGDDEWAKESFAKLWPVDEHEQYEDNFVAAVAFAAREEVPAKPRVGYKVKSWVEKVKSLRTLAGMIARGELTREKFDTKVNGSTVLQQWGNKVRILEQLPREHWKRIGKVGFYPDAYSYEEGKKVARPYASIEVDGKLWQYHDLTFEQLIQRAQSNVDTLVKPEERMKFEIRGPVRATGKYIIVKTGDKEYRPLMETSELSEARAAIRDAHSVLVQAWERVKDRDNVKERDLRREVNRPRTGQDWRKGADVTPEQFQSTFGFRGGEFGKWVGQGAGAKERQGLLNQAYDALLDLSYLLGIPPKSISLNGTLGIAFGARGSGWASAHFEPSNLVMNLTKTRGAGAIGHEWFHALDNYFARMRNDGNEVPIKGGLGDPQGDYRKANYVTYKPEPAMVHKTNPRLKMTRARLAQMHKENPDYDQYKPENWMPDPAHPQGVRPEVEERWNEVVQALNASPMFKRAQSIDKGPDGYWSRVIERAARSFENYILAKMQAQGFENDYLSNVVSLSEFPRDPERYPYLLPDEVQPIAQAFDNLFGSLQTKETDKGTALYRIEDGAMWRSELEEAVAGMAMRAAPAKGWLDTLNGLVSKGKVKADELEWTGLTDWLQMQQGRVSKEAVQDFLQGNRVVVRDVLKGGAATTKEADRIRVQLTGIGFESHEFGTEDDREIVLTRQSDGARFVYSNQENAFVLEGDEESQQPRYLGEEGQNDELAAELGKQLDALIHQEYIDPADRFYDTRYSDYVEPGGENYRELLLTLPVKKGLPQGFEARQIAGGRWGIFGQGPLPENRYASGATLEEAIEAFGRHGHGGYKSTHWDEANIVAHVRMDDRYIPRPEANMDDIERRIVEAVGANGPDSLGNGAPSSAARKGAITEQEARWYAHHRGFINVPTEDPRERVLFVEEIQSDWAQDARDKGFVDAADQEPFTQLQVEQARSRAAAVISSMDDLGFDSTGEALSTLRYDYFRTGKDPLPDYDITDEEDRETIHKWMQMDRARSTWMKRTGERVPRAPFVDKTDAWVSLAIKRVMHIAATEGYDRVAFVTGDQSTKRYGLEKVIKALSWSDVSVNGKPVKRVVLERNQYRTSDIHLTVAADGTVNSNESQLQGQTLPAILGKELAEKIMAESEGRLEGQKLRVGGSGMRTFYDHIVPAIATRALRKFGGGELQKITIPKTDGIALSHQELASDLASHMHGNMSLEEVIEAHDLPTTPDELADLVTYDRNPETMRRTAHADAKRLKERFQPGRQMKQLGFAVTQEMREHAQRGMPLFSRRPGFSFEAKDSPLHKHRTASQVHVPAPEVVDAALEKDATARRIMAKGLKPAHGDMVGVRLNINVMKSTGVAVQTLHRGKTGDGYTQNRGFWGGEVMTYEPVVTLRNAYFNVGQRQREKIAAGEGAKEPMASVDGAYVALKTHSYDGVEFRFNPKREHLFRDGLGRVLRRADEVTIVGNSVFARGTIEYYGEEDVPPRAGDAPTQGKLLKPGDNAGTPLFNRQAQQAPRGMPVPQAQAIVNRMTADWKGGITVRVVATAADLPKGPHHPGTTGLYDNGIGYVVASGHRTEKDIGRTIAHEVVQHFGVRAALGEQEYETLKKQVHAAAEAGNPAYREARDYIRRVYRNANGTPMLREGSWQEAEEIMAYMIERSVDAKGNFRPKLQFLKWVWAKIASFLRSKGLNVPFSTAELHGVWVRAMRGIREGRGAQVEQAPALAQRKDGQHQRIAQTSDGYTFYEQEDGSWSASPDGDGDAFNSLDDLFFQDPELVVDGRIYSPKAAQRERDATSSSAQKFMRDGLGKPKFRDEDPDAEGWLPERPLNAITSRTIQVDGKERPIENADGNTIATEFKHQQNFWRWFGDSKVVDAGGRPLVMYHGTKASFSAFSAAKQGASDYGASGRGFYFTQDAGTANGYASLVPGTGPGKVMAVYLAMKNPHELGARLPQNEEESRLLTERVKAAGHDGIIVRGADGLLDEAIVFDPTQIKSIHNRGPFNPTDPDILYRISDLDIAGDTGRYTPEQLQAMKNVGFATRPVPVQEKLRALWKDAGKRLAQGLVDQFAPIKDISKDAYGLLRLAKGASGAFEVLLHGGQLKLSQGVYDFDETKRGGAIERLLVPLQGEHHDFLRWVAANRAERLLKEERENLFTPADIAAFKTLADGQLKADYTLQHGPKKGQTTRDRREAYSDSLTTFNEFNRNTLDMAEQSGLIDAEGRALWEHEFYVPFYRVEDEGGVRSMHIKNAVVRQQAFKQLKGGQQKLNNDLLENTLMNWAHLIDAAAKNRAAKASLEAMQNMEAAIEATEGELRDIASSLGKRNNVVWFMDEGKKRHFLIDDPYLLTAVSALEFSGFRSPVMHALGNAKHWLTIGVTASPFFKVRNLIRDTVQAVAVAPLSGNLAGNLAEGRRVVAPGALNGRNTDEWYRLLAGGGTIHFGTMLEGSEAKRVQALVESGVDRSTILDSDEKVKGFYRRVVEPLVTAYNELGNRGEAINRAALYQQLRKQGVSHAEASLQARDMMDFSMQGSFTTVRFLTQVVPFMNARMQGMYKLGRGAAEDPKRFGAVLLATSLLSIGLLAAYGDDEDWKQREDWDRNNYWWFKAGGIAYRIPKPFEIGAMATLAERTWEAAFEPEMTNTRFRQQVVALLGDQLAMNPVPQLVKPIIDLYANRDSFTERPIETMGMEKLQPQLRFREDTSMVARGASTVLSAAGRAIGVEAPSPVQIDHLVRGYFGWLGTLIVGTADVFARPATDQPAQPTPDYWKVLTGSIASQLEDAPSRYVSAVYTQAKQLEQVYGTWRHLVTEGKVEEAAAFREEYQQELVRYRQVEAVKRAMTNLNQLRHRIEQSGATPDEKRERLRELKDRQDAIARRLAPV